MNNRIVVTSNSLLVGFALMAVWVTGCNIGVKNSRPQSQITGDKNQQPDITELENPCCSSQPAQSGGSPNSSCLQTNFGPRVLRLLSTVEYRNTILDIFGDVGVTIEIGNDISSHLQFDNITHEKPVMSENMKSYYNLAVQLAKNISTDSIAPCSAPTDSGPAIECLNQFLTQTAPRVWRRPLKEDEKDRLRGVFTATYDEVAGKHDYKAGMEDVLTAMLASNHFIYRSELGEDHEGAYKLTPFEVASALSYFYWRRPPDEVLWQKAVNGELTDQDSISKAIAQMLEDGRAEAMLKDYAKYWTESYMVLSVAKDAAIFPSFANLPAYLAKETEDFFSKVVKAGGSYEDILTADYSYGAPNLSSYYNGTMTGEKMNIDPNQRVGILGHGAFLAAHSYPDRSSPIHRGVAIIENFLCQGFPDPPAVEVPAADVAKTNRDLFKAHAENPACASCHTSIDGIGLSLEKYNGIGVFRETDNSKPVNDSGSITLDGKESKFQGLPGLANLLANSNQGRECMVRQVFRFANGRKENSTDICHIKNLTQNNDSKSPLKGIFSTIFTSPNFLLRK